MELLVARLEGGTGSTGPVPLAVVTREALMGEVIPRRWVAGPGGGRGRPVGLPPKGPTLAVMSTSMITTCSWEVARRCPDVMYQLKPVPTPFSGQL
jgi:hypothetical protein